MAAQGEREAAAISKYLEQHALAERLNDAVNEVVKARPADPVGALVALLQRHARHAKVARLAAREVLTRRGDPAVEVDVYCKAAGGGERLVARAAAPSAGSAGQGEARPLLDADPSRMGGRGVTKAAARVGADLSAAVAGTDLVELRDLDGALCRADGTADKSGAGANAIAAASLALALAGAADARVELYEHLAQQYHRGKPPARQAVPRASLVLLSGGALRAQSVSVMPRARGAREQLRVAAEVRLHLGRVLSSRHGEAAAEAVGAAGAGSFASPVEDADAALRLVEDAVRAAGLEPGRDVQLGLDVCASRLFAAGNKYDWGGGKKPRSSAEMADVYVRLRKDHEALALLEDPLASDDLEGWSSLRARMDDEFKGEAPLLLADELVSSSALRAMESFERRRCGAVSLKPSQIGTVSEAMEAARIVLDGGGTVVVAGRRGDTPASAALVPHLAVAIGAQFARCDWERLGTLVQIEEHLEAAGRLSRG